MLWRNANAAQLALLNRRASSRLVVRLDPGKLAKISQGRAHENLTRLLWRLNHQGNFRPAEYSPFRERLAPVCQR